jgi:hypothetical protein
MYVFSKSSQETLQVCPWNRPLFGTSRETLDTGRGCSNLAAGVILSADAMKVDLLQHGRAGLHPRWIWFQGMWVQKRLMQTHQQSHRPPVDRSTQLGFESADYRPARRKPRYI